MATYSDDTAIMAQGNTPAKAAAAVQHHLLALETWLRKWRIKINVDKSVQTTYFSLRRRPTRPIYMNGRLQVPQSHVVTYRGLKLDIRLTWNAHITSKRLVLTFYRLCARAHHYISA